MLKSRFTLEITDRGVECPRRRGRVDPEICWACPALKQIRAGAIVCETQTRELSSLDLPA